jgi:large subunit ribosomal protein L15
MLDRLGFKHGARKPRRRIGRGIGSGSGKTSGRGQKGAGARAGYKARPWSEGGQQPLVRRLPKRGFRNLFTVTHQVVNVGELARFQAGTEVDAAALVQAGLVHSDRLPVKLLGDGEVKASLRIHVQAASAQARRKIEAAGGSVQVGTKLAPKAGESRG